MASDKQVRSTRAFLEEQAAEREQERDEAAHRIDELTEAVRIRDRQLASKQTLQQDVSKTVKDFLPFWVPLTGIFLHLRLPEVILFPLGVYYFREVISLTF